MSQFRAYADYELPNLEFRSTKDEAVTDAIARIVSEVDFKGAARPDIIVEEVVEASLGDFFDLSDLVSSMRERMHATIGNDDALSDPAALTRLNQSEGALRDKLNEAAAEAGIRIDGYIAINKWRVSDWATSDAEA